MKNEYFQILKKLPQVPPWVCQLGLYKTSLYSRGKDAMIQDLKLKILTLNPSYTKHPISSPILLLNSAIFVVLEALGEGLQMFFQQKKRNNVWGFDWFWLLKYLSTDLVTNDQHDDITNTTFGQQMRLYVFVIYFIW